VLFTVVAACGVPTGTPCALAQLTYSVEPAGGWPSLDHYNAAVAAIQSSINRYNSFGNFSQFNNHIDVNYVAGVPTAQASYGGDIEFGGTFPNERVMMHEMAHFLGLPSGAWGGWMSDGVWDGPRGTALAKQFEGEQAVLNGDGAHFWPYGLNFDSEGSEINKQRQVAMVYAMRGDLGIGPGGPASAATSVALTSSDPIGTSGFNFKDRWSDNHFAHAGADYFTGNFALRTPESGNSFNFYADSLTINNTTFDQGLYYKGTGTAGIVNITDLRLDGGSIHHLSSIGDLFQLDGRINVNSASNIRAKQGNINILADIHGDGTLTIHETDLLNEDNRYVRFLSPDNTFVGDLVNNARFELAPNANFDFIIGLPGENNTISGPTARSTRLNGTFSLDATAADYSYGNSWQLVSAANTAYGRGFGIPGFTRTAVLWSNERYTFNQLTGVLAVAPASDLDSDGLVDADDYWTFVAHHQTDLSSYTPEQQAAFGDLDRDGDNDFDDFREFGHQFIALNGESAFAALFETSVPEPASLALAMIAATAFSLRRRRRKAPDI
jgi:hypothetical protein